MPQPSGLSHVAGVCSREGGQVSRRDTAAAFSGSSTALHACMPSLRLVPEASVGRHAWRGASMGQAILTAQ